MQLFNNCLWICKTCIVTIHHKYCILMFDHLLMYWLLNRCRWRNHEDLTVQVEGRTTSRKHQASILGMPEQNQSSMPHFGFNIHFAWNARRVPKWEKYINSHKAWNRNVQNLLNRKCVSSEKSNFMSEKEMLKMSRNGESVSSWKSNFMS